MRIAIPPEQHATVARCREWRAASWRARARCLAAIALQSTGNLLAHNGSHWAAAIAYYSLLSTFPFLLLVASIAATFAEQDWAVAQIIALLGPFVPGLEERIEAVVRDALAKSRGIGFLSVAALLWSGSRMFSALTKALNAAYDVAEIAGVLQRRLREAGMLLTIGLIFALALGADVLFAALRYLLGILPTGRRVILAALEAAVPLVFLPLAFFLIYRFIPRGRLDRRATLAGAAIAALLFLVAKELFLDYLEWFANYNLIYGSVAIAIVLALWAWLAALITLFGGEVAACLHHVLLARPPAEEMGRRQSARQSHEQVDRPEGPPREHERALARVTATDVQRREHRRRPPAWPLAVALLLALLALLARSGRRPGRAGGPRSARITGKNAGTGSGAGRRDSG